LVSTLSRAGAVGEVFGLDGMVAAHLDAAAKKVFAYACA
jgi:hypothetical protein